MAVSTLVTNAPWGMVAASQQSTGNSNLLWSSRCINQLILSPLKHRACCDSLMHCLRSAEGRAFLETSRLILIQWSIIMSLHRIENQP